jgi:hypothetical protein
MVAILKITNPVTIVNNMISLFLAKPLGAKSLLQRMFVIMSDLNRTEKEIADLKKHLNSKKISTKIDNWIDAHYKATPFANTSFGSDNITEEMKMKVDDPVGMSMNGSTY